MEMNTKTIQTSVPVTIMEVAGSLDASNYKDLIENGKKLYAEGMRYLILDLSNLSFISSAGLVAIHSLVMILKGSQPFSPEDGWSTLHNVAGDVKNNDYCNCKILNPQPGVDRTLEITGFKYFLEVHQNLEGALAAF